MFGGRVVEERVWGGCVQEKVGWVFIIMNDTMIILQNILRRLFGKWFSSVLVSIQDIFKCMQYRSMYM